MGSGGGVDTLGSGSGIRGSDLGILGGDGGFCDTLGVGAWRPGGVWRC